MEERKLALKCIPRGPVPKTMKKLDMDMLPQNLRANLDIEPKKKKFASTFFRNIQQQTLPPGQIYQETEVYKPISGDIFDKVARNQYVNGLIMNAHSSRSGDPNTAHLGKGQRAGNILREARGSYNKLRGAGREIAQDKLENLSVDGNMYSKITGWRANGNASNVSMYKESRGLEVINDQNVSLSSSFPFRKIIILSVIIYVVYRFTRR